MSVTYRVEVTIENGEKVIYISKNGKVITVIKGEPVEKIDKIIILIMKLLYILQSIGMLKLLKEIEKPHQST